MIIINSPNVCVSSVGTVIENEGGGGSSIISRLNYNDQSDNPVPSWASYRDRIVWKFVIGPEKWLTELKTVKIYARNKNNQVSGNTKTGLIGWIGDKFYYLNHETLSGTKTWYKFFENGENQQGSLHWAWKHQLVAFDEIQLLIRTRPYTGWGVEAYAYQIELKYTVVKGLLNFDLYQAVSCLKFIVFKTAIMSLENAISPYFTLINLSIYHETRNIREFAFQSHVEQENTPCLPVMGTHHVCHVSKCQVAA